jgi:polar amino acid transport system substrate-binding protein
VVAVQTERIDTRAGTALPIQDRLSKAHDSGMERAGPSTDPVSEGKAVIGYGAFGIRKDDKGLLNAFNSWLEAFIGSEKHCDLVSTFKFTELELTAEVSAQFLCG